MIAASHLGAIRFRLVVPCGLWHRELRHVEAIWLARVGSLLLRQDVALGFQVVCSGIAAAQGCSALQRKAGSQPGVLITIWAGASGFLRRTLLGTPLEAQSSPSVPVI